MRRIDPDRIRHLRTNPDHCPLQTLPQRRRQHPRRDRDAREIRHLVRLDGQFLTTVRARGRAQHQMEDVFRIDGQAADLGRLRLQRSRDPAGFAAVAV